MSKYEKELLAGQKTVLNARSRGFAAADSNFANCSCQIKIRFVPGQHISFIEVSLSQQNQIHSHKDLHPRTTKISADIVKLDPSLAVLNQTVEMANVSGVYIKPSVVAATCNDIVIRDGVPESDRIQRELAGAKSKRAMQRLCRRLRGPRTKLTIGDLDALRVSTKAEYRRRLVDDPRSAEHYPRVIGLHRVIDDKDDIAELVLTVSTTALLKFGMNYQHQFTFATDATYKRVTSDYPIVVCGLVTSRGRFQVLSMSMVLKENTKAYCKAFSHLKMETQRISRGTFSPTAGMADAADMITKALYTVFPTIKRLTCYSHMMRAVNLYVRYKCGLKGKGEWFALKRRIQQLSLAHSPVEFREGVDLLVEVYAGNTRLVNYLRRSGGFFDPESWRSKWHRFPYNDIGDVWRPRTNNGLESFNGRIKSDFCSSRILPLPEFLQAMLGVHMQKCSSESRSLSDHDQQDYSGLKSFWTSVDFTRKAGQPETLLISRRMHFVSGVNAAVTGDLCVLSNSTSAVYDIMASSTSMQQRLQEIRKQFPLVYVPVTPEELDLHPSAGGPLCSCEASVIHNHCQHITRAFSELRGYMPKAGDVSTRESTGATVIVAETLPGAKTTRSSARVGRPVASNGLTRPRKPLPALQRHTG